MKPATVSAVAGKVEKGPEGTVAKAHVWKEAAIPPTLLTLNPQITSTPT